MFAYIFANKWLHKMKPAKAFKAGACSIYF